MEHVMPRSDGAENADHWSNLVSACRKCNGKRGNLPLLKWLLVLYHQQRGKPLTKAEQGLWHER
jgi:5-methylcytosine-specific restriction endonuclease McrA